MSKAVRISRPMSGTEWRKITRITNDSRPFTPQFKASSTSNAISPPAARSASPGKKRSRRGETPPRREPNLALPNYERPKFSSRDSACEISQIRRECDNPCGLSALAVGDRVTILELRPGSPCSSISASRKRSSSRFPRGATIPRSKRMSYNWLTRAVRSPSNRSSVAAHPAKRGSGTPIIYRS